MDENKDKGMLCENTLKTIWNSWLQGVHEIIWVCNEKAKNSEKDWKGPQPCRMSIAQMHSTQKWVHDYTQ